MPLPAIDRHDLVARYVDCRTLSLLLLGSHARGDAGPLSDIDLNRHVAAPNYHGRLDCHVDAEGRLVTVKTMQPARLAVAMGVPGKAVWQVPGLRNAVVLHDPGGSAARLINQAQNFAWAGIAQEADRHVASETAQHAEEALKIASGIAAEREAQVLYGVMGMVLGLAEAMVVHRRGFIDSENRLLSIALGLMAGEWDWQAAFRVAAGHEAVPPMERGRAVLALYGETARIVASLMDDESRRVANVGLAAASQVLNRSFGLPIS